MLNLDPCSSGNVHNTVMQIHYFVMKNNFGLMGIFNQFLFVLEVILEKEKISNSNSKNNNN